MKIWISKYALSGGITEHECDSPEDGKRIYPGKPFAPYAAFYLGEDAHESRDDAVRVAEAMRIKKIASLRKQIAKLEKLTF